MLAVDLHDLTLQAGRGAQPPVTWALRQPGELDFTPGMTRLVHPREIAEMDEVERQAGRDAASERVRVNAPPAFVLRMSPASRPPSTNRSSSASASSARGGTAAPVAASARSKGSPTPT